MHNRKIVGHGCCHQYTEKVKESKDMRACKDGDRQERRIEKDDKQR